MLPGVYRPARAVLMKPQFIRSLSLEIRPHDTHARFARTDYQTLSRQIGQYYQHDIVEVYQPRIFLFPNIAGGNLVHITPSTTGNRAIHIADAKKGNLKRGAWKGQESE
jgi:hypothetical protein